VTEPWKKPPAICEIPDPEGDAKSMLCESGIVPFHNITLKLTSMYSRQSLPVSLDETKDFDEEFVKFWLIAVESKHPEPVPKYTGADQPDIANP
jgi:hypothetical protein